MQGYSDSVVLIVVVVAFIAGYAVVSFIIKHLKDLKNLPPLNEELWRQQAEAEEMRRRSGGGDRGQVERSDGRQQERKGREAGGQAEHEEGQTEEQRTVPGDGPKR